MLTEWTMFCYRYVFASDLFNDVRNPNLLREEICESGRNSIEKIIMWLMNLDYLRTSSFHHGFWDYLDIGRLHFVNLVDLERS